MGRDTIVKVRGGENTSMSRWVTPGDPAIDFALEDVQGRLIRLSDFRGKPVILAFLRGFQ
jgi:hypothetical protein